MTTISSHVLDSVIGDHAKQIRIACFRLDGAERVKVFDVIANDEGRIAEAVAVDAEEVAFELVFYSAEYFAKKSTNTPSDQLVREVVVRVVISAPSTGSGQAETERVHIPVMLAPHSYSTWWSA